MLDKTQTIRVYPYVGYVGHVDPTTARWNSDEVSGVFALTLAELLDPARISTQHFRNHPKLVFPSWRGPPLPAAMPGDPRMKKENVCVDPETGLEHYRVWGLTAYVLARWLDKYLIPMLLEMKKK